MDDAGYDVSTEHAAMLQRDVQSDSENYASPDADTFRVSRLRGKPGGWRNLLQQAARQKDRSIMG